MREPQMCNIVCKLKLDAKTAKEFKRRSMMSIGILDNLPLVVPIKRNDQDSTVYQLGFHVGLKGHYSGSKDEKYFIHNHLAFTVKYHRDVQTETARIVGFEVKPFSVKHEFDGKWDETKTRLTTCDPHAKHTVVNSNTPQEVEENNEIIFTYDVEFQESDVKWASRWDAYLLMNDDQIHWFSIVNSLMIVLFLSGMVAMIMLRTLYRDIAKYNELETQEEAQERLVGSLSMVINHDICHPWIPFSFKPRWANDSYAPALGFHGNFCWLLLNSLVQNVQRIRVEKTCPQDCNNVPCSCLCDFLYLNGLIWGQKSSGAVPFGTMFALIFLWFGISVPLVFVGSYVGFKKPAIETPVKTNKIPRQIPEQACEDYLWWWRSYLTSGSSALYLFLYATFYFFTKLEITKLVSAIFYFGYMLIASYAFFVVTGTIGFYACFWFTRLIYSSVKID
ncbi:Nonaspanin [Sesbania bispinosa]|nr:Nonaspanin [Sesbania bispinosa]